ncbi:hypothetical protein PLICRDRAFT_180003 [Plicaturopsis crispa FD-325 SS-3]|uniref:Phospholipase D/nuclease n=1 Tax=Plicaturopsis crispa FD-325 SS-3 TaxID=944288 RepID=A0A0C9SWW1_PLICR|nr:hypothetical protein PLICRDRAFT_180003 [Plicaturopsis crispa FD-325 SS-3]
MEDDADLARAIALSLQESQSQARFPPARSPPPQQNAAPIDDGEAAFQADLERALAASQAEASSITAAPAPSGSSFLSERAQLEKERVERQKRMRRAAGVVSEDEDDNSDDEEQEPPAKRQKPHPSSSSAGIDRRQTSSSTRATNGKGKAKETNTEDTQVFWDNAEVRQTACASSMPRRDGRPTFRLSEVLGPKSELQFVILSSYSTDLAWIYQGFPSDLPVILITQPDATGAENMRYAYPNWILVTPPLRGGRGCMHMKFMLLFYKTGRLRVVISTANLIEYDWHYLENTLWVQDVKRRDAPIPRDPRATEDFASVMTYVLVNLKAGPALEQMKRDHPAAVPMQEINGLQTHYDFSKVRAQLVPSVAGKHEGWPNVLRTGHPRLMKAIRAIGAWKGRGGPKLLLQYQGSSIGQYSTQWLNEFYHSAKGDSAEDWLDVPSKTRAKAPWPNINVVFPSLSTVKASALGEGGGTIFCSKRTWDAAKFPRHLFVDSKSTGGMSLMHSKMAIGIFKAKTKSSEGKRQGSFDSDSDTEDDDDEVEIVEALGWAYIGSHNFTPSAWGNLSGSAFNPVLNVTNYELGVVFPLVDEAHVQKIACFERPPRKYSASDRPWIQEESSVMQQAQGR